MKPVQLGYLGIDQYGTHYTIQKYLRKELLEQLYRKHAKQQKKRSQEMRLWQSASAVMPIYGYMYQGKVLLRIHNGMIETSKGARIEIDQGKKLWPYILCSHQQKSTINLPCVSLNGYTINVIENGNITIGCHKIEYAEMLSIAEQLKLI